MYDILALPGPNNAKSMAFGLNEAGDVVGHAFGGTVDFGVIWQAGSTPFSLAANRYNTLRGLNNSGVAVGERGETDPATHIAVLVQNPEVHDLPLPAGSGWNATDINDRGLVCGNGYYDPRSFVYDSQTGKMIHLTDILPGAKTTFVGAINGSGTVAGYTDSSAFVFFYSGQVKTLGQHIAFDLNDDGIVCGAVLKPSEPPGWTHAVPVTWDTRKVSPAPKELPLLPGFTAGQAMGINKDGDVVGNCWTQSNAPDSAFIYSKSKDESQNLNKLILDPDWHLEGATSINNKGYIAGYGEYRGQDPTAFLLTPQLHTMNGDVGFPEHIDIEIPVSFDIAVGNVLVGGNGWLISLKGGPPRPVDPLPRSWMQLTPAKRDALMKLVLDELATYIVDAGTREKVRTELLKSAQASVDWMMKSVAESPKARAEVTPELQARMDEILARRFGPGANPRLEWK
jgi:uncharacterized membrane protein